MLSYRECFRFPVSTPEARRDLLIGGIWLFALPIGWILNLGHRLDVVRRLHAGEIPVFGGFSPYGRTFFRGLKPLLAILLYLFPGTAVAWIAYSLPGTARIVLAALATMLIVIGVFALPGGMTLNAVSDDVSYLYRPDRSLRRAIDGGQKYLHAWRIGLSAVALSFLGLFAVGVGFLFASVWAWQVVGYAFSRALILTEPRKKEDEQ
jgi:hypothetical protein